MPTINLATVEKTLRNTAAKLAELMDRYWLLVGLGIIALYLAVLTSTAAKRPFDSDELFTLKVSSLAFNDIWAALLTGIEQLPPAIHVATRTVHSLFGEGHVTSRIPGILGLSCLGICMMIFVRASYPMPYAVMAALFPLLTVAAAFGNQVRPYGLVLGLCGLSLVFWQAATLPRGRIFALIGLTLALAAAISSHYYAGLIFFPIAAGELARLIMRKRVDYGVLFSLAAGATPLIAFLPLIRGALSQLDRENFQTPAMMIAIVYRNTMHPALITLVTIMFAVAAWRWIASSAGEVVHPPKHLMPFHELIAMAVLCLLPVVLFVIARTITGAFSLHYSIPYVAGVGVILALCCYHGTEGAHLPSAVLVAMMVLFLCGQLVKPVSGGWDPRSLPDAVVFRSDEKPIVVANHFAFMEFTHYAPSDLITRLYYLADKEASANAWGTSLLERDFVALAQFVPLNVVQYKSFVEQHPNFWVYDPLHSSRRGGWLLDTLRQHGAEVRFVAQDRAGYCFSVSFPRKSS